MIFKLSVLVALLCFTANAAPTGKGTVQHVLKDFIPEREAGEVAQLFESVSEAEASEMSNALADLFIYAVKERVTVDKSKLVQALNDRESRDNLTSVYDKMVENLSQIMPQQEAEGLGRIFGKADFDKAIATLVEYVAFAMPDKLKMTKEAFLESLKVDRSVERLTTLLTRLIPEEDAAEVVHIFHSFSGATQRNQGAEVLTDFILFAVKGKANVERAALLQILKDQEDDSSDSNSSTYASAEANEMVAELSKVMPQRVAEEIANYFKLVSSIRGSMAAIGAMVDLVEYVMPEKMKMTKEEFLDTLKLNH